MDIHDIYPIYVRVKFSEGVGNQTMVVAEVSGTNMRVSHADAVEAIEDLFADRGWPPPQLENATEKFDSCIDSQ